MACRIVSCVSKGGMSLPVVTCHNRPSEAHCSGCGYLQAALQASPFACMVVHNTPSTMAGLLHIEIAGVVRRVRWFRRVMRMVSALFPRLLLHIRASQGGVMSLKIEINQCWIGCASAYRKREINLRGQGGARSRSHGASSRRYSHDPTRGRQTRSRTSYRHGTRGTTHY